MTKIKNITDTEAIEETINDMEEVRISPHCIEVEQSILGSILLKPALIGIGSKRIKPNYFYKAAHQIVFECMIELFERSVPIDLMTLTQRLKEKGYLENVGGISYLTSLTTIVPTTNNYNYYMDIIIEKYTRREGIKFINYVKELLYSGTIEEIEKGIVDFKNMISNRKNIEELYIDASTVQKSNDLGEFISTGFNTLDSMLAGGFRATSLTILTGEPGSGKSTLINQILAGAISDGHKTFLYSGELPSNDLMKWFNVTVANTYHVVDKVDNRGIRYKDVTDYCWDIVGEWAKEKLMIFGDDSIANKNNILATIEHLVNSKNIKLFILDNLMTFDLDEDDKQYQQQKKLCLELKALAKKYRVSIILVAHPKKPSGSERPTIYDVAGASEIVGSADTVIRTMRSENEDSDSDSRILLLKNRWGGITNRALTVKFDFNRKRFYSNGYERERDYGYDKNK